MLTGHCIKISCCSHGKRQLKSTLDATSWLLKSGTCDNFEPSLVITGRIRERWLPRKGHCNKAFSLDSQTGCKQEVVTGGRGVIGERDYCMTFWEN